MPTNALGQPIGPPLETALPRPRPDRSAMEGRFCRLVGLDAAAHGDALWQAFAEDPEGRGWTYLLQDPPTDRAAFDAWLAGCAASEDPLYFVVLDPEGRAMGHATFMRIQPEAGSIEVGTIHFAPRLQGTPAATEAMFLMMARAFDGLGNRRYEWKCDALNAPSRRAAARLGFTYEGTFAKALAYKGRNRDTAWFAIVNDDWPRAKAAFEAWLAPGNFDDDGRQRRRLEEIRDTL